MQLAGAQELRCAALRGRIWTVPPTRERKGPNPKPEIRGPKEGRNPKSEMPERGFGLRYSAFFRVSALGIRIWAAGDGWYCPDTPSLRQPETFFLPQPGAMLTNLSVEWPFSQGDLFAPLYSRLAPVSSGKHRLAQFIKL
jgi:hypothetical protein